MDQWPDHPAIVGDGYFSDYYCLNDSVDFFVDALAAAGVAPRDLVAVYIRSGYEYLVTVLALARLDATPVLLDVLDNPLQTKKMIEDSGAGYVVTHDADAYLLEDVLNECDCESRTVPGAPDFTLVHCLRDSGEKAACAGVVFFVDETGDCAFVPHEAIVAGALEMAERFDLSEDDVVASTDSMASRKSITVIVASFLTGAGLSLNRTSQFSDRDWLHTAPSHGVTVFASRPRHLTRLLDARGADGAPPWPQLRAVISSGGDNDEDFLRYFAAELPAVCIHLITGSAEGGMSSAIGLHACPAAAGGSGSGARHAVGAHAGPPGTMRLAARHELKMAVPLRRLIDEALFDGRASRCRCGR
ncbi:AMP-binding protein [Amycolatopsis alba]|uniref:AMP-binding protein n=1 Tax=Amycolatopsis alba TaxID=76020 RepID=UPI00037A38DF|nr:AMP-binding protein [Amycolatopsis alba]